MIELHAADEILNEHILWSATPEVMAHPEEYKYNPNDVGVDATRRVGMVARRMGGEGLA